MQIIRVHNIISTNRGANSKRMQRDFYERVVQTLREGNVIFTNGWCKFQEKATWFLRMGGANSKRMQCDFYERVVQILREGNVISTRGWCEWSGRRESKLFCPCIVWYSFGEWKFGVHVFFSSILCMKTVKRWNKSGFYAGNREDNWNAISTRRENEIRVHTYI